MRISYDDLRGVFYEILRGRGVDEKYAVELSTVFADNSVDGIYSHGVNRFPRFIQYIDDGYVHVDVVPECVASFQGLERWNGRLGMGPVNARICMDRACDLAREYGIGMVALCNTNHWMRGGTYGWQAAGRGCIGICWTNTMPHMPAWGAKDCRIGNNPFIIAVPRSNGAHIVLDSAVAQFANGKIEETKLKGAQLPVPGGYDSQGNLTTDPAEIEKTQRVLPIGYWKGSGMSIVFDLMASILSGGKSVTELKHTCKAEYALCQAFIAVDPTHMSAPDVSDEIINKVLADVAASEPVKPGGTISYPGERVLRTREENMRDGIPVLEAIWKKVQALRKN